MTDHGHKPKLLAALYIAAVVACVAIGVAWWGFIAWAIYRVVDWVTEQ